MGIDRVFYVNPHEFLTAYQNSDDPSADHATNTEAKSPENAAKTTEPNTKAAH